ncbi:Zn-ribbon domain-containing OB-fold protein [Arthrobacter sp. W4I7]|uniref:Zn-ribbon domain-containing OB-fold protein n=1 Tax=Arthrobacter sp. W4I7 TaxID=3042296 RepID=UPI0027856436|nr:OB-fold domain-containing protein [Arthrobacter sp. W4I7]MDQ0691327.1 putative OB-fold protein [Arthrobacter sp. W4I7]
MTYPAPAAPKEAPKNLPDVTEPKSAPFWEAAKNHVLVAQRCGDCGDVRFPYVELCPKCWSTNQSWEPTTPEGELYSFVVYHRALDPSKKDDIPYVIGRVVTDEGVIFNVRLDTAPGEAVVGMRVKASWHDVTDEVTLLRFAAA